MYRGVRLLTVPWKMRDEDATCGEASMLAEGNPENTAARDSVLQQSAISRQ
jgi:hypothetical protein